MEDNKDDEVRLWATEGLFMTCSVMMIMMMISLNIEIIKPVKVKVTRYTDSSLAQQTLLL